VQTGDRHQLGAPVPRTARRPPLGGRSAGSSGRRTGSFASAPPRSDAVSHQSAPPRRVQIEEYHPSVHHRLLAPRPAGANHPFAAGTHKADRRPLAGRITCLWPCCCPDITTRSLPASDQLRGPYPVGRTGIWLCRWGMVTARSTSLARNHHTYWGLVQHSRRAQHLTGSSAVVTQQRRRVAIRKPVRRLVWRRPPDINRPALPHADPARGRGQRGRDHDCDRGSRRL